VSFIVSAGVVAVLAAGGVVAFEVLADGNSRKAALPECARPAATIARPSRLPSAFPFPSGTVFTRVFRNRTTRGVPTAEGRMPLDLQQAGNLLENELPRAGFKILLPLRTSTELTAFYDVKGFSGRLKVSTLMGCRGATSFSVSARPTLLGRGFAQ
jgi:hypothetical protein